MSNGLRRCAGCDRPSSTRLCHACCTWPVVPALNPEIIRLAQQMDREIVEAYYRKHQPDPDWIDGLCDHIERSST